MDVRLYSNVCVEKVYRKTNLQKSFLFFFYEDKKNCLQKFPLLFSLKKKNFW